MLCNKNVGDLWDYIYNSWTFFTKCSWLYDFLFRSYASLKFGKISHLKFKILKKFRKSRTLITGPSIFVLKASNYIWNTKFRKNFYNTKKAYIIQKKGHVYKFKSFLCKNIFFDFSHKKKFSIFGKFQPSLQFQPSYIIIPPPLFEGDWKI